jgi:outer membrane autotransporter protein
VGDKVSNMVDTHLGDTHLASLTGKSGVATGEQAQNTGVWIQGYGFRGEQDRRNNVDGYTADAYGFGVGADTEINPDLRVGAFLSYGQADINDSGVNLGNKTEINSYQATLFSSKIMDGWYWNAGLSAAKHDYDTKRIVLSNVVSGKHEAMQYSAKIDAGLPFKLSRATLTPVASLAYSRLNEDGYSESGVGALSIGDRDTDSLRSGLGAKALIPLSDSSIKTSLELRTIWNHEFANTAQDTVARFTAGGSAFTTTALSPTRDSANLGAALRLTGGDDIVRQSLTVSYDAEIKQQYLSHTAQIQARFDF